MGRVVKGMEDWTVADLFNTGPAPLPSQTRIDGFSPEGGTIYVRPSAVTWELMVHEALHQMGKGFDDMTIMVNMGKMYGEDPNKGGVVPDPNNSQQISDKIKEKCN
jgi:pantothenate kinase